MSDKCERLVCVVTYDRKNFVDLWLKAWNNADKCGAKLAVLHAFDGEKPDQDESQNILKHLPDFYVPFRNTRLRDMQALALVLSKRAGLPEWDQLFWFTDDMLPMRRSFLRPFVKKISDPEVGLVAQCYEPRTIQGGGEHIRTVAYAINSDVGSRLSLPEVGREEDRPYMFEHGIPGVYEDHILKQVRRMGYKFELCHSEPESPNYLHWTSFLDWMWDCHLLGSWTDMWGVYESQFERHQPWDVRSREDCLLSVREFEERTSLANKVCAIVPTSSAPIEYLLWSVFSLLLRSDPNVLEHVIVGINGPDERTGSPELQDKKQRFVEDLRGLKWRGKDMPVTLVRTWSRIGHAQMLDQCTPWVHTEFYLCMHDDVLVTSRDWHAELDSFSDDESLAIKAPGPVLCHPLWSAEGRLELPHLDTSFSLCRKSLIRESGATWSGYYLPMKFHIGNLANFERFEQFNKKENMTSDGSVWPGPIKDQEYSVLSVDVGGMMLYELIRHGYSFGRISSERAVHFVGKSWKESDLDASQVSHVLDLESELEGYPEFKSLYLKYRW